MELMIVDNNGWSKIVNIRKAITRIGSGTANDIQIESDRISPVHLQIIYSSEHPSRCKLTNLSDEVTIHTDVGDFLLPSYQTVDLEDGYEIEVGGFRLVPKLPLSAGYMQTSSQIDAALSFPDPVLRHGYAAVGQLTITNKGDQSDCQFDVTLRGLADDCFRIDPIPLMYPGAQESIRVQLVHRGYFPQAGTHEVVFSITAPEHYPGEELIIKQDVIVMPVYKQSLEIIDDILGDVSDSTQLESDVGQVDEINIDLSSSEIASIPDVDNFKPIPDPSSSETVIRNKEAPHVDATPVRDLSKLKVVRDQFDEFWEEE
jgi:hypothetical protein